jgi:hypothetical protein
LAFATGLPAKLNNSCFSWPDCLEQLFPRLRHLLIELCHFMDDWRDLRCLRRLETLALLAPTGLVYFRKDPLILYAPEGLRRLQLQLSTDSLLTNRFKHEVKTLRQPASATVEELCPFQLWSVRLGNECLPSLEQASFVGSRAFVRSLRPAQLPNLRLLQWRNEEGGPLHRHTTPDALQLVQKAVQLDETLPFPIPH